MISYRSSLKYVPRLINPRYSHSTAPLNLDGLEKWIASPPTSIRTDKLNLEHILDLYCTLPTRDGTRKPYHEPKETDPLSYGHHLTFFHARRPESLLRADGTDEDISPPAPFLRRMWAGGKIKWNNQHPLLIGNKATTKSSVGSAVKKGFEKGRPMVFVTQNINITMDGNATPSVEEERSHVYFPEDLPKAKGGVREVDGLPSSPEFSFKYTPTAVTLFRYSALMFNAHHIHLDPIYTWKVEGYAERLVHGPLTALMLLEAVAFHQPEAKFEQFEYRATNPLLVNREMTINGVWEDKLTAKLWCVDEQGVVGMTGTVRVQ